MVSPLAHDQASFYDGQTRWSATTSSQVDGQVENRGTSPYALRRGWRVVRAICMTMILILNLVISTLAMIALAWGSGGSYQVAMIVLNIFSVFVILINYVMKRNFGESITPKQRYIWTFLGLTLLSFVLVQFAVLLARLRRSASGNLSDDLRTIGGLATRNIVIVISCFSFCFSIVGLASAQASQYGEYSNRSTFEFKEGPGFSYPAVLDIGDLGRPVSQDPSVFDPETGIGYSKGQVVPPKEIHPKHIQELGRDRFYNVSLDDNTPRKQ